MFIYKIDLNAYRMFFNIAFLKSVLTNSHLNPAKHNG